MFRFFEAENSFVIDFFPRLLRHIILCKIFMRTIRKRLPPTNKLNLRWIRVHNRPFSDHKFDRTCRLWKRIHLLWWLISICRTCIYVGIALIVLLRVLLTSLILIVLISLTLIILLLPTHKRIYPVSLHLLLKNMTQIFILLHLLLKNLLQLNSLIPHLPNIQLILLYWLLDLFYLLFKPFHSLKISSNFYFLVLNLLLLLSLMCALYSH